MMPGNSSKSKDVALLTLMDRSGYNIVQENGQRKYGPPPEWHGPPPAKGSEVFVGKIPRDLYEDELVPIFERIGRIYEVRLMMDFSGSNRGYAFVMYTNNGDAKRAVRELDNYEIRKGRFIGVCKSVDNCRLFVGGIPKSKTREEILFEMKKVTEYVSDVILYSSISDKSKNRGFAFVEYENHRAAAMARRKLIPGKIQLWGHEIAVDWAEPEPEVDENTMSKESINKNSPVSSNDLLEIYFDETRKLEVTVLYVRNLMMTTTEEHLKEIFSLGDMIRVEKVKKLRDFAFVHFRSREEAERALIKLNNAIIDNSIIEVTWAKPVERSTRQQHSRSGTVQPATTVTNYSPFAYSQTNIDPFNYSSTFSFAEPTGITSGNNAVVPKIAIRGRGAAGLRGLRNYGTGPRLSLAYKSVEMLLDMCQKNGWGEPIFQLHSTVHESNENMQLFVYKVTIPGLPAPFNQFQPSKLCHLPDEAKNDAANYVLIQLGLIDVMESAGNIAGLSAYSPRLGPQNYLPPLSSLSNMGRGQGDVGNLFVSSLSQNSPPIRLPGHSSSLKPHSSFDTSSFFEMLSPSTTGQMPLF